MISEGDVFVAHLPQADGGIKLRPVLLLRELPGFGDFLACGISTQLHQQIVGCDLYLKEGTAEFAQSGLTAASIVRLSFLSAVPVQRMARRLGRVSADCVACLQRSLADRLTSDHKQ